MRAAPERRAGGGLAPSGLISGPIPALIPALLAVHACAHAPETPEQVAAAWVEAVRAGDAEAAGALSTAGTPGPQDLALARAAVGDGPVGEATRLVEVQSDAGSVLVARGPEGARIVSAVVAPLSGATPDGAALTFIRAVEAGRAELMLAVMPAAVASRQAAQTALASEAVAELRGGATDALRAALPAKQTGEDAAAVTGGGWQLTLTREAGGWKVHDIRREDAWR